MESIYDIVYDYIDTFYRGVKLSGDDKKTIHHEVRKVLAKGWCADEIMKMFKEAKRKRPSFQSLKLSCLFTAKSRKKLNLIHPDVFYYHNDLRLTCAPPRREVDYDSGEVKVINEPYFLEMKASYSVDDLVYYFQRQTNSKKGDPNRLKGSFGYLLKSYKVEEILYMIDVMVNTCLSEDMPLPDSPLDCQKHYKDAMKMRDNKRTETILAGGKKVVRKKRVRSN